MLNRDIYQNVALYTDYETIKNLIECDDIFVDALDTDLFWEKKFKYERIPPIYQKHETVHEWIREYENISNIKGLVDKIMNRIVIDKCDTIALQNIKLSFLNIILTDHQIKYLLDGCKSRSGNYDLYIYSYNKFKSAKLYVFFYSHLSAIAKNTKIKHDDILQILFCAKYIKMEVITKSDHGYKAIY